MEPKISGRCAHKRSATRILADLARGLRSTSSAVATSGFLVNTGGATASDIIQLMEIVQATVLDKFGVKLEPEVRIIGE